MATKIEKSLYSRAQEHIEVLQKLAQVLEAYKRSPDSVVTEDPISVLITMGIEQTKAETLFRLLESNPSIFKPNKRASIQSVWRIKEEWDRQVEGLGKLRQWFLSRQQTEKVDKSNTMSRVTPAQVAVETGAVLNEVQRGWVGFFADSVAYFAKRQVVGEAFWKPAPGSLIGSMPPVNVIEMRRIIAESQLFDEAYYQSQTGVLPANIDSLTHYLELGWRKGLDPNPLFSVAYYQHMLPELTDHDVEPLSHYILFGSDAQHDPHPFFRTSIYAQYRGAKTSNVTWLEDFYAAGHDAVLTSEIFDGEYYARQIPNIELPSYASRLLHYIVKGWRYGYYFSPVFSPEYYFSQVNNLREELEPYLHYCIFGAYEGLKPNYLFDPEYYFSQVDDERYSPVNPLENYLQNSRINGARPSVFFDSVSYKRKYLVGSNVEPLVHYLSEGFTRDLSPTEGFGSAEYRQVFMEKSSREVRPSPVEHFLQRGALQLNRERVLKLFHLEQRAEQARPIELTAQSEGLTLPEDLKAKVTFKQYPGKLQFQPGRPTVMVVAHAASEHLFGGERSYLDMLEGLSACDVNVVAVVPRNAPTYTNEIRKQAQFVFAFSYGWWRKEQNPSEDAEAVFEQIISQFAIDIVYANTIMLRECLDAAVRLNRTTVVHIRELIAQDQALIELIGQEPAQIVDTVRAKVDWLICNSNATKEAFDKPGQTFTIYNTTNFSIPPAPWPANEEKVKFALISSNLPKKGLQDVVELAKLAVDRCPNAEFILIGPETDATREIQREQAAGRCPGNITLPGYAETPGHAMAMTHVVLSFSHFAESFGRTVLEGMANCRPVIAYEYGAVPELIRHGVSGFLVPYRRFDLALDHIEFFCNNKDKISLFGKSGQQFARDRFGLDAYRESFKRAFSFIKPEAIAVKGQYRRETIGGPIVRAAKQSDLRSLVTVPKIAYFCWHFPVPSETFVLNELEALVRSGADVLVYCKQIPHKDFKPAFPIKFERVVDVSDLANKLKETGRTIVHAHFVYPTVTDMVWPACELAGVPFTFIAHAQDIFRYENDRKNRLSEIGASHLCKAAFTLSNFHMKYMVARGFPANKIIINPNAVDTTRFNSAQVVDRNRRPFRRIVAVHRYVKKKGLDLLIRAAAFIQDMDVEIELYGYGEEEALYRDLVAELNLTNLKINGLLSQEEVIDTLKRADLFVCPAVRVNDGDMDGLPTSIVESMAAGVPVLTTSVGALPELVTHNISGIVAEPTPESIAAAIRHFYNMPSDQVSSIINTAKQRASRSHDALRLTRVLLRVWKNQTVDIIIVSWNNLQELRAVVDRALQNTATPFHLIICDNQSSSEPVPQYLDALYERESRVTVIHNDRNAMVGPGTNMALSHGVSDVAIYLCGKEGFSFERGWELPFIHRFAEDDKLGLVGTIGTSPTYLTGKDYQNGISLFHKFRNKKFAQDNPDRKFGHIQGGLFAMRRAMVDQIGGFSDDVSHDYTDVEYSYYAESKGWALGETSGVLALFNKSRPTLSQRFDESVVVAHPVLLPDLQKFDAIRRGALSHCNVCDAYFEDYGSSRLCEACRSTAEDRTLFRYLSESILMYRRLPSLAVGLSGSMLEMWSQQFQGPQLSQHDMLATLRAKGRLTNNQNSMHLIYLKLDKLNKLDVEAIVIEVARLARADAVVLVEQNAFFAESESMLDAFSKSFSQRRYLNYSSSAVQYSYSPLIEFRR